MLVWLALLFYDFCGFRSVAVNSVYKLQFFYIFNDKEHQLLRHCVVQWDVKNPRWHNHNFSPTVQAIGTKFAK